MVAPDNEWFLCQNKNLSFLYNCLILFAFTKYKKKCQDIVKEKLSFKIIFLTLFISRRKDKIKKRSIH
jgi:hypothetical protein